jgi:beta-lactamase regulating signal transducer with metallopeptidase domain
MNSSLRALDSLFPAALTVLLLSTVLLISAIAASVLLKRFAVVRHAILLSALITIGSSPAMMVLAGHLGAPRFGALPGATVLHTTALRPAASPVQTNNHPAAAPALTWPGIFILLWMLGIFFGTFRLFRGLRVMNRIRRSAKPASEEMQAALHDRLRDLVGDAPPAILTSDQVGVPVALGCMRPVVVLPSTFPDRFNQHELMQMVLHECAHVKRRDTALGLYQRILTIVLWFHPLLYLANHLLDAAREEICDNYVLSLVTASEYSRTLLAVAQAVTPFPNGCFAPTLVRSARQLEHRVAGLLHARRSTMTRLSFKALSVIVAAFIGGGIVLSCMAATPQAPLNSSNELTHVVPFELGTSYFPNGDSITIDQVLGTSDIISAGNVYQVKGTYKLVSQDKALLAAFVTTGHGSQPTPNMRTQKLTVEKGEGRFSLIFYVWYEGSPHVSFYPVSSGDSFAGVYFGTGSSVFRMPRTHVHDVVTDTTRSK